MYAAAARGQAEELQMWNADGTIGVSGELAGEIGFTVNDIETVHLESEISCVD